ncbi:MAG: hypothetical protein GQ569_11910 [Methylococcaceae bacterium]|nr:hypothetical protein [Methylococcaceae bacterium]
MDIEELKNNLNTFMNNCSHDNYIYNELTFDEAYPDITPTSFIVNLVAKKSWEYPTIGQALDTLIDALRMTTETETRRNIFTLSLYTIDEMVNSERIRDKEQIATNPDLTPKQINQLYKDKKQSIGYKIINNIKDGELTKQQVINLIDTDNKIIIGLLIKRYSEDNSFSTFICADKDLKFKILEHKI